MARLIDTLPTRSFVSAFHSMDDLRDTDGRPLGEERASAEVLEGVSMETTVCPFPGSRNGLTMNLATLKQLKGGWDPVLGAMAEVNRAYLAHVGRPRVDNWCDAIGVCTAVVSLPAFLYRRPVDPIGDGDLPVIAAALYKVAIGALSVITAILSRQCSHPSDPAVERVDPELLVQFAEDTGRLVGANLACSGSFWRIIKAMTALLDPPDDVRFEGMCEMVPELGQFAEVSACAAGQLLCAEALNVLDQVGEHHVLHGYVEREGHDHASGSVGGTVHGHWQGLQNLPSVDSIQSALGRLLESVEQSKLLEVDAFRAYCADREPSGGDVDRLVGFMGISTAAASMGDQTRAWLAGEILGYAEFRRRYGELINSREQRIGALLHQGAPGIRPTDSHLFPRLHTHAWLEALAGLRLEFEAGGVSARFRDDVITLMSA